MVGGIWPTMRMMTDLAGRPAGQLVFLPDAIITVTTGQQVATDELYLNALGK